MPSQFMCTFASLRFRIIALRLLFLRLPIMSPRSSSRGVWSIGSIRFGLPHVEDLCAFHQRKGEARDFSQGNAEGRDSEWRARVLHGWKASARFGWAPVFVSRLDFCSHISSEEFETRIAKRVEARALPAFPRASCLVFARYMRPLSPFSFGAQA